MSVERIDYLLFEQRDAQFLRIDTTLKADKIKGLNRIILKMADSYDKHESILKVKNDEIAARKEANDELVIKYNKQEKKLKNFKSTTLIFGCTTLILSGLIILIH